MRRDNAPMSKMRMPMMTIVDPKGRAKRRRLPCIRSDVSDEEETENNWTSANESGWIIR